MAFVSVTRLRIRSFRFLPMFLIHAMRSVAQAKRADGYFDGQLLPDRKMTFWTMTIWRGQSDMRAFILSGDHLKAMPKLLTWCDEASVVNWVQEDATLPDWNDAARHMRTAGRPSKLRNPSANHVDLSYAEPRTTKAVGIGAS